jgi:DAK2 domain fusion protein YloV
MSTSILWNFEWSEGCKLIQSITGTLFRDMVIHAAAAIEKRKQQINELNVFPVPDGDTGTNMSLTIGAGAVALKSADVTTVSKAADITANALLRGACGNSGVILSLLFRGIAKSMKELVTASPTDFARALQAGVSAAYKAVMKPTEGTILTVSRLSADAAYDFAQADCNCNLIDLLTHTIDIGNNVLAQTVDMNPVLKKAGVVDAGGKGYICILEGMLAALKGEKVEYTAPDAAEVNDKADFSAFDDKEIVFTYCTEFIVSRENNHNPEILRDYLSGIGDSIVLVDDDDLIKVHVHTNSPGAVLTQALTYGSLLTVKIENMREQHNEKLRSEIETEAQKVAPAKPEKKYGFVAVCAGDGMTDVFNSLGIDGVITGGQTMNPSTESILEKIDATPADIVYVFPNNKNIIMAARQCGPLTEKKVIVIPSKTVPQGIAAMLCADTTLEEDELTATFNAAISGVRTAQITLAARDSDYDGHTIHTGEYLALLDGALVGCHADFDLLLGDIIAKFTELDPELITVYYGSDVDESAAEAARSKIAAGLPEADVSLVNGGQPVYHYIISAE